jgi:hypothetical protein
MKEEKAQCALSSLVTWYAVLGDMRNILPSRAWKPTLSLSSSPLSFSQTFRVSSSRRLEKFGLFKCSPLVSFGFSPPTEQKSFRLFRFSLEISTWVKFTSFDNFGKSPYTKKKQ